MKKLFAKTLALVGLGVALASAPKAEAQQYSLITTLVTNAFIGTNASATGFTSNYVTKATLTKTEEILLVLRGKCQQAAGTDPFVVNWSTSGDGTKFGTTGGLRGSFLVTPNGTTEFVMTTNIYVGSAGYFNITNIIGPTNGILTNFYAEVYDKPVRH